MIKGTGADNDAYFNIGYANGLQHVSKGNISYVLVHQHTGNSSTGGGCYTVASTQSFYSTGRFTGERAYTRDGKDYYYYICNRFGEKYAGLGTAGDSHWEYKTVYGLGCGYEEGDIVRTTTDYSSIQPNEKITKVVIDY